MLADRRGHRAVAGADCGEGVGEQPSGDPNRGSLSRQSAILARDPGLEISRVTLNGWVMRVGELVAPVAGAMLREILAGS